MAFFENKTSGIGVDISDQSIKVAEVLLRDGSASILALGAAALTPNTLQRGRIRDPAALAAALVRACESAKPRPITLPAPLVCGFPETEVYSFVLSVEPQETEDSGILAYRAALSSLPIYEDDLAVFSATLVASAEVRHILVVGTSKETLREWQGFFSAAGIAPVGFGLESQALFGGFFPLPPPGPLCLIDIGAVLTSVSVFDEAGGPWQSDTLAFGGDMITEAIAEAFRKTREEAEAYKRQPWILEPESRALQVIVRSLEPLARSARDVCAMFRSGFGRDVEAIVLAGGGSRLAKLDAYLCANLRKRVVAGALPFGEGGAGRTVFAEAVGLARRCAAYEKGPSDGEIVVAPPAYLKAAAEAKAAPQFSREPPRPVPLPHAPSSFVRKEGMDIWDKVLYGFTRG
jgi:Tfp pilus assembly PilM family ATPase